MMAWRQAVELDVGGTIYKTSIQTLRQQAGSYFDRMFTSSGEWKELIDRQGNIRLFIDRDPEAFGYVLDYLRNGPMDVVLPTNLEMRQRARREAVFYQLKPLVDAIDNEYIPKLRLRFSSPGTPGVSEVIALSYAQVKSIPGNRFERLFFGDLTSDGDRDIIELKIDDDGHYVIEREKHRYAAMVAKYLKYGRGALLCVPDSDTPFSSIDSKLLLQEAQYFNVVKIMDDYADLKSRFADILYV